MSAMPTNLTIEDQRKGGRTTNSPERLALRLVRAWPQLTDHQRAIVTAALKPLVAPQDQGGEAA